MFECEDTEFEEYLDRLVPDPKPGWEGPLRFTWTDDDNYTLSPLWDLVDGDAQVVEDATVEEARDAWEHAAAWTQRELDDSEHLFRVMEAARTRKLLTTYRAAIQDLKHRYGNGQGHRGSPGVQLFFAQTALALQMYPNQVAHRVDTAEILDRQLPKTWQEYLSGRAPWAVVDLAVRIADGMTGDAWAAYDEQVVDAVRTPGHEPQDRTSIGSLPRKFRTIREQVQRDTMIDRARRTREARTTQIEHGPDGQSSLIITGPTVEVTAMDAVLHKGAITARGAADEDRGIGQLRYDIAVDLILEGAKVAADPESTTVTVPKRKGIVPTVVITVPVLSLLGVTDEPARLEGVGPIDIETAKRLAVNAPSFHRLLTHPITGVRLDLDRKTYVPPADLRLWVKLRDETCRFPGCTRAAHRCDVDHADEWQNGGVTAAANLVSLCRPHHNGKSSGLATETLRPDDSAEWDTPWRTLTDPPPEPFDPAPRHLLPEPDDEPCPF